jgi:hypothetical protein
LRLTFQELHSVVRNVPPLGGSKRALEDDVVVGGCRHRHRDGWYPVAFLDVPRITLNVAFAEDHLHPRDFDALPLRAPVGVEDVLSGRLHNVLRIILALATTRSPRAADFPAPSTSGGSTHGLPTIHPATYDLFASCFR